MPYSENIWKTLRKCKVQYIFSATKVHQFGLTMVCASKFFNYF